ncbi:four-helix bundle copper-binding protein [Methyloversatilis sp. XJ19-13]|uniref:four-helix bundle copper-binding protein n=1 Tax=Methyloversatilis sp. XJ19-13 TaxID=2963430 RepID=UPI00211C640A|nr:four-helix bundle copper-binding protein [Methyloversatilis sp. XJ19-13]MCQ9374894.1 four-helix bundle copper-binding protein [Methyloversatilis sp. XJ19-13]
MRAPSASAHGHTIKKGSDMDRRELIGALGAATAAGLSGKVLAQHDPAHDHHHHGGKASVASTPHMKLIASTSTCISTGEVCREHCIRLLSEGDKGMGDCAKAVSQMLALCTALQSLAAQNSPLLVATATVALEGCNRCADACKPHVDHHAECKACFDACQDCIKACKALT